MRNIKSKLSRLEKLEVKSDPGPSVVIYQPGEEPRIPETRAKVVICLPDNGRGQANETN